MVKVDEYNDIVKIDDKEYKINTESIRQDDCAPTVRHWTCYAERNGIEYRFEMMFEGENFDQCDLKDFDWEYASIEEA